MRHNDKLNQILSGKDDRSVYVVAEVGINHNGSLEEALKLVEAAKEAKVDAVKFQKRNLAVIYSPQILANHNSAEWNFDYIMPLLQKFELSESDYRTIQKKCLELDLDLIVTPFDEQSAEFVSTLGVVAFKISSSDMINFDLIKKCACYGLPLLISTGMWSEEEIISCSEFYKSNNINYSFLLANSTYPTPYESVNLKFIEKLKQLSKVVGYSGHERGIFIPVAAVAMGAKIIEKHITFNKHADGPDHKASLLPQEFKQMVADIRDLENALGSVKEVNQAEKLNKEVFAKSAVAKTIIKKGYILRPEDIQFRAPGKGIFPHEVNKYFGLVFSREVPIGQYISKKDFETELKNVEWKKFSFSKPWGVKCRFHDYNEYSVIEPAVIEFHCSESDLAVEFNGKSTKTALVVHAPEIMGRELVDICCEDEQKIAKSINILQRTIEKVLEMSSNWPLAKPKIVTHLGGMILDRSNKRSINKKMIQNAIKNFKKLKYDPEEIEILPENLPPRPWYLGGEWHQYGFMPAEDFMEFCGALNLGMTFDLCHAALYCNYAKISLVEYIEKVKNLIKHVHISDASGINGEGLQINEGELNFVAAFAALNKIQFSWVPEIWSGHLHNGAGVYKALCALEQYNKYI
jgi:N-acetylneuraminate synthase